MVVCNMLLAVKIILNLLIFIKSASSFYRCDSIEKLKAQLPKMEQELKDQGKFKDFYQFTFNFAKNPGQKGLGTDHSSLLWICCAFLFYFLLLFFPPLINYSLVI